MEGSLKPGTKVRSKVTTMFGTVKLGDVVTIAGPYGFEDMYAVKLETGEEAALKRHEFTVLRDQSVSPDEMERRKRKALHCVYDLKGLPI